MTSASRPPKKQPNPETLKLLRNSDGWYAVCPKCRVKLEGTLQEIQKHAC